VKRSDGLNSYFVYGGHLRSELEFPSLLPGRAERVDWTLRVAESGLQAKECRLRGVREYGNGWTMRLFDSSTGGMRVEFGAAGTYDVEPRKGSRGWEIVWYPSEDVVPELVRATVLGPVMALTLLSSGVLSLHGSAVSIDGEAVVFMAPPLSGRSKLVASLVAEGARLVADDIVAIEPAPRPMVRPGLQRVEVPLYQSRMPESLPLSTIYVLELEETAMKLAPAREPLDLTGAARDLGLRTTLRDRLVGAGAAVTQLRWIGQVVQRVPVHKLHLPRDGAQLPEVVECLLHWHEAKGELALCAN
jgi:hypothetical protein